MASVTFDYNNTNQILSQANSAIMKALNMCGLQMERYAKLACPVDTGRLRNSITHASSGDSPRTYRYTITRRSRYDSASYNNRGQLRRVTLGAQAVEGGRDNIPAVPDKPYTVYVGTNVSYAPYIEMGTVINGRHRAPRPFLKPAVSDHVQTYQAIIRNCLKNA